MLSSEAYDVISHSFVETWGETQCVKDDYNSVTFLIVCGGEAHICTDEDHAEVCGHMEVMLQCTFSSTWEGEVSSDITSSTIARPSSSSTINVVFTWDAVYFM